MKNFRLCTVFSFACDGEQQTLPPSQTFNHTILESRTSTQEHIHALHDKVLLWVIRMLLTGDLQNSRDRLVIIFEDVTHIVRYVLIDQNNANVISLGERSQSVLDDLWLCVLFYGEEIGRVRGPVAHPSKEKAGHGVLISNYS